MIYRDCVRPQLAPAYDIVCMAALPGFASYGTNVAIDRLQRAQTHEQLANFARMSGLSVRVVLAAGKSGGAAAKKHWPQLLDELPTPEGMK